jgi:hypothetical protein
MMRTIAARLKENDGRVLLLDALDGTHAQKRARERQKRWCN